MGMRMNVKPLQVLLFLLLIISGCQSPDRRSGSSENTSNASLPEPNGDFFQKISPELGIRFKHSIGDHHLDNLIESVGGGAVFLDYDQDGYLDLYTSSGSYTENLSKGERPEGDPVNRLYHNLGDGTFEDVTEHAGVGDRGKFAG